MEHVGTCHVSDGLYSSLRNTILVVSANTTETQSLTKARTMLTELTGAEYTVVGMELSDGDTNIGRFRFQTHLAPNCVAGGGG